MPILFLDHSGELGGAERSMLELIARLDPSRLRPILACPLEGPLADRARGMGLEPWPFEAPEAARHASREAWAASPLSTAWSARSFGLALWHLAQRAKAEGVVAIHTNTLKAHVLGAPLARLAGTELVWHLRDLPSSRGNAGRLLTWAAKLGRPKAIAIAEAVRRDWPLVVREQARVVHNGIDLASFDARAAAEAPPALPQEPVVASLSHLIPWKGHGDFLGAVAKLAPRFPEVAWAVGGDDIFQFQGERERLRALAEMLGVSEQVAFLGHVEAVPSFMKALHLFVLPSHHEPFGRVLLEAMAAGRPVVATRGGGVPEVVVHGETGLLVPPGRPDALAEAIGELLSDPARAEAMGEAGRRRVAERFSLQATVAGVESAYESFGWLPKRVASGL